MVLAAAGDRTRRRGSRRRSTRGCRPTSPASSGAIAQALERHGAANVAVVVLDNASGEWLAWEGSGDYSDAEHGGAINGPITPRQPGSALKPFTYALAFESGFTPASVLADVPSHFPDRRGGRRSTARATTTAAIAVRCSRAGRSPDPRTFPRSCSRPSSACPRCSASSRARVSRPSIATPSYYGLGLTLGNAEVRLDELVAAYSTFRARRRVARSRRGRSTTDAPAAGA